MIDSDAFDVAMELQFDMKYCELLSHPIPAVMQTNDQIMDHLVNDKNLQHPKIETFSSINCNQGKIL